MSSAMNHKKRSRYSHKIKGGAFNASSRRAFYRDTYSRNGRGFLSRLFHRRSPKQTPSKETVVHQEG